MLKRLLLLLLLLLPSVPAAAETVVVHAGRPIGAHVHLSGDSGGDHWREAIGSDASAALLASAATLADVRRLEYVEFAMVRGRAVE